MSDLNRCYGQGKKVPYILLNFLIKTSGRRGLDLMQAFYRLVELRPTNTVICTTACLDDVRAHV